MSVYSWELNTRGVLKVGERGAKSFPKSNNLGSFSKLELENASINNSIHTPQIRVFTYSGCYTWKTYQLKYTEIFEKLAAHDN